HPSNCVQRAYSPPIPTLRPKPPISPPIPTHRVENLEKIQKSSVSPGLKIPKSETPLQVPIQRNSNELYHKEFDNMPKRDLKPLRVATDLDMNKFQEPYLQTTNSITSSVLQQLRAIQRDLELEKEKVKVEMTKNRPKSSVYSAPKRRPREQKNQKQENQSNDAFRSSNWEQNLKIQKEKLDFIEEFTAVPIIHKPRFMHHSIERDEDGWTRVANSSECVLNTFLILIFVYKILTLHLDRQHEMQHEVIKQQQKVLETLRGQMIPEATTNIKIGEPTIIEEFLRRKTDMEKFIPQKQDNCLLEEFSKHHGRNFSYSETPITLSSLRKDILDETDVILSSESRLIATNLYPNSEERPESRLSLRKTKCDRNGFGATIEDAEPEDEQKEIFNLNVMDAINEQRLKHLLELETNHNERRNLLVNSNELPDFPSTQIVKEVTNRKRREMKKAKSRETEILGQDSTLFSMNIGLAGLNLFPDHL
ncbi:hypothetical protein HK096_004832, partial [Nowakowskiella sp. JEL0078]